LKKLLEAEIPEVFDGTVEVKAIERAAGYKSKVAVVCTSREVDPVGTCVGVGGSRIKPILKELGGFEKIDLLLWSENAEEFVRESLSPAKINKVRVDFDSQTATVWLDEDQRSLAIGKMGQNIALASKITGLKINLFKPDDFESNEKDINPDFA
jgi:N utilization substance protein A